MCRINSSMDVLFKTLLLSQAGSPTNFRNKYPFVIFILFLTLVCLLSLIFLRAVNTSNTQDAFKAVLFSAIISYPLVYHIELFLYLFMITGIFYFIIPFLPFEYKNYYFLNSFYIIFYICMGIFLLSPIYDLYMYYNSKQTPKTAAGQIPAQPQSAGSSRKRHK